MTCDSKKCKNEREELKKTVSENCHHVWFGNDGTEKNTKTKVNM